MELLSFDEGKMEYEFTCIATDSKPMFIGLWDTDDLSACQRVAAQKFGRDEIVYDSETGIGFFNTVDGLRWCFKKKPVIRAVGPFNQINEGKTAEDILASL
jgi:hypothetical protein